MPIALFLGPGSFDLWMLRVEPVLHVSNLPTSFTIPIVIIRLPELARSIKMALVESHLFH